MQVFLPYPNFLDSAEVLDSKRLGNQCYRECLTLYNGKWPNHPVAKMWKDYKGALAVYGLACAIAMSKRPNWRQEVKDRWYGFWLRESGKHDLIAPPFVGNEEFHRSHQSNLVRKDPEHYGKIFVDVPDDLEYIWTV